jgi:serine/threonine-protein kinase
MTSATRSELMILPVENDSASGFRSGRATSFAGGFAGGFVGGAAFSPDGRWLAYFSTETGRSEIYVRPFPAAAGQWQVSSDGGSCPIWSPNGRELFYQAPDSRLMAASYSAQDGSFHVGTRRPWSETRMPPCSGDRTFDLHPDGKRFAMLQALPEATETRHRSVVLVQNFFDELRRLAPPK